MELKRFTGVFVAVVFLLVTALAFAAGENWVVIKDKNGVCKVIQAKGKTPATIAGPFKTKDEAKKAKEKECHKGAVSASGEVKDKAKGAADKTKQKTREKTKEVAPFQKK
ncbi:MAG: hypothetical protein ACP5U1_00860 [Desulfomonilaceae bacterium]